MTTDDSPRTLLDPVHGSIQLESYLVKIIDTPEFQRLRKIKQLGGACFVYPGATHTRFEHSIGVCHIAGHLIKELNIHPAPNEPPWNTGVKEPVWITEEEGMCIKIAALCHDLGHGPYSHLYDFAVESYFEELDPTGKRNFLGPSVSDQTKDEELKLPEEAKHEYRSACIVEKIITRLQENEAKENECRQAEKLEPVKEFENINIGLIQAMIKFSEEYKKYEKEKKSWEDVTANTPKTKSYLFEIVANGFTGIDVDKMDYFARDSRSVGLPNSFDWRRFAQTANIIKTPDGFCHICSRDKDAIALYELFHTRNILHRTVYRHKTVVIIEHKIKEALKNATDAVTFHRFKLLECWKNPDAFLCLDDSIEDLIMKSSNCENKVMKIEATAVEDQIAMKDQTSALRVSTKLAISKKCYENIRKRKLPKFVGHTDKEGKPRDKAVCIASNPEDTDKITELLIQLTAKFSYGKGSKNPMEDHFFYSKLNPQSPYHLPKDEVSKFLPEKFEEKEYFWYYDTTHHDAEWLGDPKDMARALRELLNTDRRGNLEEEPQDDV